MSNNCACSLPNSENSGNMYFRGAWEFCPEYKVGDVVLYQGTLYLALKPSAGKAPLMNTEYWRTLNFPSVTPTEDHDILDGGYSTPLTRKNTEMRLRRDSTVNWEANNPRLELGELGVDMDLHRAKIGNGIDCWNELPYLNDDLYEKIEELTNNFSDLELKVENYSKEFTEEVYKHIRNREEILQYQIDLLAETSIKNSLDHKGEKHWIGKE